MGKTTKRLFTAAGHVLFAVGFVGIFLPLLPTTPFVILAAWCYERGSPRFHALLLENKYVGPYVYNWKRNRSIPLRAKVVAVTMITASIGWTVYAAPLIAVKVVMATIGVCVSAYIVTRPTTRKDRASDP